MLISAGQEVEVREEKIDRPPVPRVSTAVAWRKKTLVFEDAPLDQVAAEFNRYNTMRFEIAPAVGAQRRLSGTFDPLRPEYFQAYLEKDGTLSVREEDGVVRVRRR
jgi:transmembrane sensor